MAIQELDVRILHRSGRHNSNADALSRVPLEQPELHQEDDLLLRALNRLKRCPDEVCDIFWPPDRPTRNQTTAHWKKRRLRAANLRKGEM